jgi:hypothetical protein
MKMLPIIFEEWGIGVNFSLDYMNFHLEKIISKKSTLLPLSQEILKYYKERLS